MLQFRGSLNQVLSLLTTVLASIWLNKRPKKDCRIVIVVCLCGGVDGLIRLVRSEKKSPEFRSLNIEVGKFELNICKWA